MTPPNMRELFSTSNGCETIRKILENLREAWAQSSWTHPCLKKNIILYCDTTRKFSRLVSFVRFLLEIARQINNYDFRGCVLERHADALLLEVSIIYFHHRTSTQSDPIMPKNKNHQIISWYHIPPSGFSKIAEQGIFTRPTTSWADPCGPVLPHPTTQRAMSQGDAPASITVQTNPTSQPWT
jgi:hypothetical protein